MDSPRQPAQPPYLPPHQILCLGHLTAVPPILLGSMQSLQNHRPRYRLHAGFSFSHEAHLCCFRLFDFLDFLFLAIYKLLFEVDWIFEISEFRLLLLILKSNLWRLWLICEQEALFRGYEAWLTPSWSKFLAKNYAYPEKVILGSKMYLFVIFII